MNSGPRLINALRRIKAKFFRPRSGGCGQNSESAMAAMLAIGLRYCTAPISSIMDIGANDGHDTSMLADYFNLDPSSVYAVEAHPKLCAALREQYPEFHVLECAISDRDGVGELQAVQPEARNNGVSSLSRRRLKPDSFTSTPISVETKTLTSLMDEIGIRTVAFLKIDVEGSTFEVLKGAGDRLKGVVALQLETEVVEVFAGQHLHDEVAQILIEHGFTMTYLQRHVTQADTVWVRSDCLAQPSDFYLDTETVGEPEGTAH